MKKLIFTLLFLTNLPICAMQPHDDDELALGFAFFQAYWDEAIERNREELAERLEEQDHQNTLNEELIGAAIDNGIERAKALIEAGADVHYERKYGNPRNAFIHAVEEGYLNICELCINAGININDLKMKFTSPSALFYAKSYETGRFLLAHGANVHIERGYGWTVLHEAASNMCPELCQAYIQEGANVFKKNDFGMSPLKSALTTRDLPTCELLANKMLTIPTPEQKARMYSFLWCLKQLAHQNYSLLYNIDIRKFLVQFIIKRENLPIVIEQISGTSQEEIKIQLLAKYAQH